MKHQIKIFSKIKKRNLFLFTTLILIFCAAGFHGYILEPDSISYIQMNPTREPVYPLFLALFRFLFGENIYLNVICLFQILLASIVITIFTSALNRQFHFRYYINFLIAFLFTVPYWIDTIWYRPFGIRTNRILPEGILISIFYLFLFFLLKTIWQRKFMYWYFAILCCVFMVNCRSQMYVCVPVVLLAGFFLVRKTQPLFLLKSSIALILMGVTILAIPKVYSLTITGHTSSSYANRLTLLTNFLYASDEKDYQLFPDTEMQQFFLDLYQQIAEHKASYQFTDNAIENANNLHASHDLIKYTLIANTMTDYQNSWGNFQGQSPTYSNEEVLQILFQTLSTANVKQWLYNCSCSLYKGFLRSIFIARDGVLAFATVYCASLYLASIILVIFLTKKRKLQGIYPMVLLLFFIIVNCFGVALTIFDLFRYFIYSTGFFYISLLCLLTGIPKFRSLLCHTTKTIG